MVPQTSACDLELKARIQLTMSVEFVLILWYINSYGGQRLIQFRLDRHSGLPVYRQLVDQVRQALRLGILLPDDQLPTVRDVVEQVAINPNTVHRAYQELEGQGLIEGQPGRRHLRPTITARISRHQRALERRLVAWFRAARAAGLHDEAIEALIANAKRLSESEDPL